MRVPVEMPDRIYGRLATVADERGVKIADLIGDAVARIVGDVRVKSNPTVKGQILAARRAGRTWQSIADEFGMPKSTVRYTAGAKR